MSALQAIPTPHGIDILNSELKQTVTKYQLVGALTHDAASETLYTFHTATIETSYYDESGVLTFILNLPIETHFDEYLHRIDVLDSQNQAVIECPTPKIALAKGIGGMVTLKAAIKGQAGDVVFKHGEYVTETELLDLYLPKKESVDNAASDADIDSNSYDLKHIKLPQLWRAFGRKVKSASLTVRGLVQLSNKFDGESESVAVTEKALKTGLIANAYNPNILINSRFIINQMNIASWDDVAIGDYGWDMYKKVSETHIRQPVEEGNFVPNTVHTLSASDGTLRKVTSPPSGHWDSDDLNISVNVDWVKLEKGEIATLCEHESKAIALLGCQRYFEVLMNDLTGSKPYSGNGYVSWYFKVQKRVMPIIHFASGSSGYNASYSDIDKIQTTTSNHHAVIRKGSTASARI